MVRVDHKRAQRAPGARWPSQDVLTLWDQHGGEWHGPHVETATMPMYLLPAFLEAYAVRVLTGSLAVADNGRLTARVAELEEAVKTARADALEEAAKVADDADLSAEVEELAARAQGDGETAIRMSIRGAEARRIARLTRALPGSPS